MAEYFLDSSGLAKLYMVEAGSAWLNALVHSRRHEFFIVRIMAVEVAAAIFRRVTAGSFSMAQAVAALVALRLDLPRTYHILDITPALTELALQIAERHRLRGYDCVQLAGALSTQRRRVAASLSPLVLVSADSELNAAARAEGLSVEDPNTHP